MNCNVEMYNKGIKYFGIFLIISSTLTIIIIGLIFFPNILFEFTLLGIGTLIIIGIILLKPDLGLSLMIGTIPLQEYMSLPGELSGYTSITSIIGYITFIAFLVRYKNKYHSLKIQDNFFVITYLLFFVLLIIGELVKPVFIGYSYIITFVQIAVMMFMAAKFYDDLNNLNYLVYIFTIINLVASLFSLSGFKALSDLGNISRVAGFQGNANEYGIYISISIILLVYWFSRANNLLLRSSLGASIAFSFFMLVLSGSRGALLFLLPVLVLQLLRIRKNKITTIIFLAIITYYLFGALQYWLPEGYLTRFTEIPNIIAESSDTLGLRYELWKYGLMLWAEKPIFGIGSGLFYFYSIYFPITGTRNLLAHNIYITFLVENGIIGLLLFSAIALKAIMNYELGIKYQKTYANLFITFESILFILLLNGTKANLETNKLMWLCFAISISIYQIKIRVMREEGNSVI